MRGFCVGGDMEILPNKFTKNERIFAYTQLTHLIFRTVIDIVSIVYYTKNNVGWLCVGGVSGV